MIGHKPDYRPGHRPVSCVRCQREFWNERALRGHDKACRVMDAMRIAIWLEIILRDPETMAEIVAAIKAKGPNPWQTK